MEFFVFLYQVVMFVANLIFAGLLIGAVMKLYGIHRELVKANEFAGAQTRLIAHIANIASPVDLPNPEPESLVTEWRQA